MQRCLFAMLLACAPATPAVAQPAATVETSPPDAPVWTEAANGTARLARAGIVVPAAVGEYQRFNLGNQLGGALDAHANYRSDSATVTIFLYQPILDETDLVWPAVKREMAQRVRAPAGWPIPEGLLSLKRGTAAQATISSGAGDQTVTDLAALARTSDGWLVKLRISASIAAPDAALLAQRFLDAIEPANGVTLRAPVLQAPPPCAPREVRGEPRLLSPQDKFEARLVTTLVAVTPLIGVGHDAAPIARCSLGEIPVSVATAFVYRTAAPDAPPTYVATLGGGGTSLTLQPVEGDGAARVWWLTLDLTSERIVFQRWRGDVDDADFLRAVRSFEQIFGQPYVTRVGRN